MLGPFLKAAEGEDTEEEKPEKAAKEKAQDSIVSFFEMMGSKGTALAIMESFKKREEFRKKQLEEKNSLFRKSNQNQQFDFDNLLDDIRKQQELKDTLATPQNKTKKKPIKTTTLYSKDTLDLETNRSILVKS